MCLPSFLYKSIYNGVDNSRAEWIALLPAWRFYTLFPALVQCPYQRPAQDTW